MSKVCFTCKMDLPLKEFSKSNMKYQLKTDLGRMRVCKVCTFKRTVSSLKTVKYNYEERKFEVIQFKNKLQAINWLIKNKCI